MSGKRKIALVGIGKIARDQHIPSLADSADWTLAAAVSRSAKVDGVPNYASLSEMLERHPEIGTVSLSMPPGARFSYAAEALAAGRNVMLEKPPGATLSEVETLARMAAARNLSLFATWHSREAAQVDAARTWLAGKTIEALDVTWQEDVRKWHPGQDWVFEPGGMGVFDPGINALSIVTAILEHPLHLTSAGLDFPANRQTPIAATLTFHHPHGGQVGATFDWDHSGTDVWTIAVQTSGGKLTLENGGASLWRDGSRMAAPRDGLSGEYPRLYARMADLVRTGLSDVDVSPLRHVADAFMLGERRTVDPFEW